MRVFFSENKNDKPLCDIIVTFVTFVTLVSVESEVIMCWDRGLGLGQHHNQWSECVFHICLEEKLTKENKKS